MEHIVQEYKSGKSAPEIADENDISTYKVYEVLEENDVQRRRSGPKSSECPIDRSKLVELYEDGMYKNEIAEQLGVSTYLVSKWLDEQGVKTRKRQSANTEFFKNIDSEHSAYWLGFLAADGSVGKNNAIFMELGSRDEDHIRSFKDAIGSDNKISNRVKNGVELSYFQMKSVEIAKQLRNYGLDEKKTASFSPPNISKKLERHFWRGYIDGDGTLPVQYRYGSQRYTLEVCGTIHVADAFSDYVSRVHGVDAQKYREYEGYVKVCYEGENVRGIVDELYRDANVYLERKMRIANQYIEEVDDGVREIPREIAKQFFEENHYLDSLPVAVKSYAYFEDSQIVAVGSFGSPTSFAAQQTLFGAEHAEKVRELRRFAITKGMNRKNLASMALAQMLKRYREDNKDIWAVLSYADTDEGHEGTIYKAIGAIELEGASPEVVFEKDGKKIPQRRLAKLDDVSDVKVRKSSGKKKFCILLGSGKQKRKRKKLLNV